MSKPITKLLLKTRNRVRTEGLYSQFSKLKSFLIYFIKAPMVSPEEHSLRSPPHNMDSLLKVYTTEGIPISTYRLGKSLISPACRSFTEHIWKGKSKVILFI